MEKIQLLFPLLPANSRSTKANEAKEGDLQCIGILTMNWDRIQLLKKKTLHGFEMPRQPHFIKHNRTAWESVCQNTLTVFNSQFLDHLLRLSFWYKTALLPCLSIMRSFKYCSMSFYGGKHHPGLVEVTDWYARTLAQRFFTHFMASTILCWFESISSLWVSGP